MGWVLEAEHGTEYGDVDLVSDCGTTSSDGCDPLPHCALTL